MAIIKGAMTYTRFRVTSSSDYSPEAIAERLNLFRFRALDPRADDLETRGFVPFQSEYDDEKTITVQDFYFDGRIALSLRMDSIRVPKELLRVLTKKSIAAYQREHKRFPDRTVKKEIELAESKGLRAKILPTTKIIEALWCQKGQDLRLFSRSTTSIDRFIELFQQCFVLKPERRDFPTEALSFSESKQLALPANFSHEPLYVPPLRVEMN
jgi:hypothetical protein